MQQNNGSNDAFSISGGAVWFEAKVGDASEFLASLLGLGSTLRDAMASGSAPSSGLDQQFTAARRGLGSQPQQVMVTVEVDGVNQYEVEGQSHDFWRLVMQEGYELQKTQNGQLLLRRPKSESRPGTGRSRDDQGQQGSTPRSDGRQS